MAETQVSLPNCVIGQVVEHESYP